MLKRTGYTNANKMKKNEYADKIAQNLSDLLNII